MPPVRSTGRLDAIDGLRAVAMTMVIAEHCGLLPFGWIGVWLFYVISGFVISRNFMAERAKAPPKGAHYLSFLIRRFFRIVPAYALYIAINCAIIYSIGPSDQYRDLPYLATFIYNWQMSLSLSHIYHPWSAFGHLWTISVEEQFYLVFPFLFLGLTRRKYLSAVVFLIAVAPFFRFEMANILLAAGMKDPLQLAFAIYSSSVGQIDAFLAGCLLANFEPQFRSRPMLSKRLGICALLSLVTYASAYVLLNWKLHDAKGAEAFRNVISGILYGDGREVWVYTAIDLCCAAVVAFAVSQGHRIQVLSNAVLAGVGRISYSGYLYHALILLLVTRLQHFPPKSLSVPYRIFEFSGIWLSTVFVAKCSYRFVEQNFIRYAHQVSSRVLNRHARLYQTTDGVV